MPELGALEHLLNRTERRIRLSRALSFLGYATVLGFTLAFVVRAWLRLHEHARAPLRDLGLVLGVVLLVSVVRAGVRVRRSDSASRLDRAHALHDRVRSALEFASRPAAERTAFMEAAVRDALAHARELSPERAVSFAAPRGLGYVLLPCLAWLAVTLWPAAVPAKVVAASVPRAHALDDDALSAFRGELKALENRAELTEAAREDIQRYNALLERIGTGELDRAEALEALLSLEKKLMEEQGAHGELDKQALRELANDLAKADETLAKALEANDADKAAKALEKLAQRTKEGALSAEEQKRLQESLAQARKRAEERDANAKKKDELESLLKKKEPKPDASPAEKSLFEKKKRELEQLRREVAEQQARHRELERLSRDLSDSSRALDQGQSNDASDAMQRGAEDLSRYGQDSMTQKQREELQKQVQQLREMMQRNGGQQQQQQNSRGGGQNGGQRSPQQRFVLRANGQDPDAPQTEIRMRKPGQGNQGQGQQGEGKDGQQQGEGKEGPEGKNGQKGEGQAGQGEGQEGQGQGKKGQGNGKQVLEIGGEGESSAVLELPGMGQGQQRTETVRGASQEHDPHTLKNATELDAQHDDSQLGGTPGKGPTRSQVILDAADRGFATSSYRKVYTDYKNHAEDVLERDEIPPGYRFYVRRYFQLIRPRQPRETP